jgi:predicted nucleotidyltransferase
MGIEEPPPFIHGTVDLLARAFAADRIVLFGSYAKGAARPDSDVDLLVIANLIGDPSVHERRARNLVDRCFPRVDVVVCTPEDVAEADGAWSIFLHSILDTGITMYRRPRLTVAGSR